LQPMVIITSIEVHHVDCEFHDWLHYVLSHYHEGSDRTICEHRSHPHRHRVTHAVAVQCQQPDGR
jgi:hypothetical protein